MPTFATVRHVAHSADEMFDLVADVERYPEFVPLCERLVLLKRGSEDGRDVLIADMTVGYKAFRETFTTRVALDRGAEKINVSYLTGPFRHLVAEWRFEADGREATRVHFTIDYEFRSRVLAALMGAVFDRAFRKFAEAFEARADAVYGVSA